jgi:hypothetical protein
MSPNGPRCLALLLVALLLGCSLPGCGGANDKLDVHGRLTKKGEPARPKEINGMVVGKIQVRLYPQKDGKFNPKESYSGAVSPQDGTFTIPRVPPGQYKICVLWKDDPTQEEDTLRDKFSFQKSTLIREIKPGEKLNIDVGS